MFVVMGSLDGFTKEENMTLCIIYEYLEISKETL